MMMGMGHLLNTRCEEGNAPIWKLARQGLRVRQWSTKITYKVIFATFAFPSVILSLLSVTRTLTPNFWIILINHLVSN